jgi:hypothetical protein
MNVDININQICIKVLLSVRVPQYGTIWDKNLTSGKKKLLTSLYSATFTIRIKSYSHSLVEYIYNNVPDLFILAESTNSI